MQVPFDMSGRTGSIPFRKGCRTSKPLVRRVLPAVPRTKEESRSEERLLGCSLTCD